MKRTSIILIVAIATLESCHMLDGGERSPYTRGIATGRSIVDSASLEEIPTGTYVMAVEYPDGYDWHGTTAEAQVSRRLVLFRNQKRVLSIYGSYDTQWLAGGHIYTSTVADSATMLAKDGKILFSFPAEEEICGLLLHGGEVHTLGMNKAGLSYRIDGAKAFDEPAASLVCNPDDSTWPTGLLAEDQGNVCFAYSMGVGNSRTWHIASDGEKLDVSVPKYVDEVFDMRIIGGDVCYVCNSKLSPEVPEIHIGSKRIQCESGGATDLSGCSLIPSGTRLYLKGMRHFSGNRTAMTLWSPAGKIIASGSGIFDYYVDDGTIASVCVDADSSVTAIRIGDKRYEAEGKLLSRRMGCFHDEVLHLLLSPVSSVSNPTMWRNGASLAIPVNGDLLSMEIIQ